MFSMFKKKISKEETDMAKMRLENGKLVMNTEVPKQPAAETIQHKPQEFNNKVFTKVEVEEPDFVNVPTEELIEEDYTKVEAHDDLGFDDQPTAEEIAQYEQYKQEVQLKKEYDRQQAYLKQQQEQQRAQYEQAPQQEQVQVVNLVVACLDGVSYNFVVHAQELEQVYATLKQAMESNKIILIENILIDTKKIIGISPIVN